MIKSKITREEVEEIIREQNEVREGLANLCINVPTIERATDYKSFKPVFDKFTGSRARCFTSAMFKHSFRELVIAEENARGCKLSKNDITNLSERLNQVLVSFFDIHAKNPLRVEYKNQYLSYLRQGK